MQQRLRRLTLPRHLRTNPERLPAGLPPGLIRARTSHSAQLSEQTRSFYQPHIQIAGLTPGLTQARRARSRAVPAHRYKSFEELDRAAQDHLRKREADEADTQEIPSDADELVTVMCGSSISSNALSASAALQEVMN